MSLMAGVRLDGWTGLVLVTTVLTNVTGFGFTFRTLLPSHIVGGVSLLLLPVAIAARYWKPALIVLAPTQKEPPFLVTQVLVLALFVWLGRAAIRGFRVESVARVG